MILSYPLTTVDRPTDRPLTIVKCIFFYFSGESCTSSSASSCISTRRSWGSWGSWCLSSDV